MSPAPARIAGATVTCAYAAVPSVIAVTRAVPPRFPVKRPTESITATVESETNHLTPAVRWA